MLMRCAAGMMKAPLGVAAGLVFATGIATGVAVGAGLVGAAVVGRRIWEERRGWRSGASSGDDTLPPVEPAAESPSA